VKLEGISRNKTKKYLKDKIIYLKIHSKNKKLRDLYRGINDFKGVTNLEVT
jgi:hypothetical protein